MIERKDGRRYEIQEGEDRHRKEKMERKDMRTNRNQGPNIIN
jgi:hypothetical protein